jgi:hypothetical protein
VLLRKLDIRAHSPLGGYDFQIEVRASKHQVMTMKAYVRPILIELSFIKKLRI